LAKPVIVFPATRYEPSERVTSMSAATRWQSDDDERVEVVVVQVAERRGVVDQLLVLRRVEEAHRDQVAERVLTLVAGVAPGVELTLAAVRAGDRHLVAHLRERGESMSQLGAPEADGDSERRRRRRVPDHDQDLLRLVGIGDVDLAAHLSS
jgi:hypothetical protein